MRKLFLYLASIFSLLMIPFIASQRSEDVNWSGTDYLVAFILLALLFLGIEIILKFVKNKKALWILVFCLLMVLLWIELAVGIFYTPIAGS